MGNAFSGCFFLLLRNEGGSQPWRQNKDVELGVKISSKQSGELNAFGEAAGVDATERVSNVFIHGPSPS